MISVMRKTYDAAFKAKVAFEAAAASGSKTRVVKKKQSGFPWLKGRG